MCFELFDPGDPDLYLEFVPKSNQLEFFLSYEYTNMISI